MKPRFSRAVTQEMPFLDHLEELRWRILWSLIAVAIGAVIGFFLVVRFDVLGLLVAPIEPLLGGTQLKYLSPTDPFFLSLKLGVGAGVLMAAPIVVQQIWSFVSPALLPHERRAIVPALYLGLVLFLGGVALAYFIVLPITLEFMMGFQAESLEQNITIGHYMSFVVRVLLAFGLVFELPVMMLVLSVIGLVDSRMLAAKRRYAIVASVIIASVITPGDFIVLTIFMMIPLLLLYELSIGLAKLVERRRVQGGEVAA